MVPERRGGLNPAPKICKSQTGQDWRMSRLSDATKNPGQRVTVTSFQHTQCPPEVHPPTNLSSAFGDGQAGIDIGMVVVVAVVVVVQGSVGVVVEDQLTQWWLWSYAGSQWGEEGVGRRGGGIGDGCRRGGGSRDEG